MGVGEKVWDHGRECVAQDESVGLWVGKCVVVLGKVCGCGRGGVAVEKKT